MLNRIISLFMTIVLLISLFTVFVVNVSADDLVTVNELKDNVKYINDARSQSNTNVSIEDTNVFLKQQTNYTCTLVSATMMVRRTAILAGLDNWDTITETSMRKVAWLENKGLYYNFSYSLNGTKITVKGYENGLSGSYEKKKAKLISLLEAHPEGVVVYNHWPAHAILLTKYDESTDTFYCADPAPNVTKGQIPLAKSSVDGSGQTNKISGLDTYWIVTSPTVQNEKTLTIYYHANGGMIEEPTAIGTAYKVNTSAGITVRRGPGTNYADFGGYDNGKVITVLETQKKSDYIWGRIDYKGEEGWVALGDWMVNMGTAYDNQYYLSSSVVYDRYTSDPVSRKWKYGQQHQDGLHNNTTFSLYRDGYTFLGWSLSPDGGTIIDQDAVITPESIVPELENASQTVTMYAIWKANECSHDYQYQYDNKELGEYQDTHHWKECTKCGDVKDYSEHNWIAEPATQASHIYTCSVCGVYDLVNHEYDSECDAYCNVCNHERSVTHEHEYQYVGNKTMHWKVCSKCGSEIDPSGHRFSTETEIKDGYEHFTCKKCGYIHKEPIKETPEETTDAPCRHSYENRTVKPATCSEMGLAEQYCVLCGDSLTYPISKIEHVYGEWYNYLLNNVVVERRDCTGCDYFDIRSSDVIQESTEEITTETDTEMQSVNHEPWSNFGCMGNIHVSVLWVVAVCALALMTVSKKEHI